MFPLLAVLVLLPAAPLLVLGARQLPPTQRLTKVAQALRSSLTKAFTPDNGAGARARFGLARGVGGVEVSLRREPCKNQTFWAPSDPRRVVNFGGPTYAERTFFIENKELCGTRDGVTLRLAIIPGLTDDVQCAAMHLRSGGKPRKGKKGRGRRL